MKKALLVGINKYAMPGNNLNGCINDVTNLRNILMTYYGYTVDEIRVLTNERATYDNIMERLEWLVKDDAERYVFQFSGHGSQIRDRNGDELRDGLDEILCPHDMNWENKFITDDQLEEIFSRVKSGVLDVVLDSCHSGTATRNCTGVKELSWSSEPAVPISPTLARFIPPPIDIQCREEAGLPVRGIFSWLKNLITAPFHSDKPFVSMNHSLLAGCRSEQYCMDAHIDGSPNGAFTYYLCKAIRAANGSISRKDLKNRTKNSLRYHGFEQVPQLEAPKSLFYEKVFC